MTPACRQAAAHWALVAALCAPGVVLWAIGLAICAPAWLAAMGAAAIAVVSLWQCATRLPGPGGEP